MKPRAKSRIMALIESLPPAEQAEAMGHLSVRMRAYIIGRGFIGRSWWRRVLP